MTVKSKKNFLISVAFLGMCLLLFYLGMKYILPWVTPFLIALVISACLQRPIRYLTKKTKLRQRLVAVLLMAAVFILLAFVVFIVGYQLAGQLADFFQNIITMFTESPTGSPQIWDQLLHMLPGSLADTLQGLGTTLTEGLGDILKEIAVTFSSAAASFATSKLPVILIGFIITIVASFFFCMDYEKIKLFFSAQIPESQRPVVREVKNYMVTTVFRMLRSYLIIMSITFVELSIGFLILKVDYAILVAALVAIVDILPVLGTGTVLIPWILYSLITGNYFMAIGLLILYIVITVLRQVIEPKVVSGQIGLHPIVTLVAMYIGLQAFGLLGMFIFPVTILLLIHLQKSGLIHLWNDPREELEPDLPESGGSSAAPASVENSDSSKD